MASLAKHFEKWAISGETIVGCFQETRCSETLQESITRRAGKHNSTIQWGNPVTKAPSHAWRRRRAGALAGNGALGVAIAALQPTKIWVSKPVRCLDATPCNDAEAILWDSCRFCRANVPIGGARDLFEIGCYYGISGSAEGHAKWRRNEANLRDIFNVFNGIGDKPCAIAMDANVTVERSHVLQEMLESGQWFDAASLAGQQELPTFCADPKWDGQPRSGATRIGMVFLNLAAKKVFAGYSRVNIGVPGHYAIRVDFNLDAFSARGDCVSKPAPLPDMVPLHRLPLDEAYAEEIRGESIWNNEFKSYFDDAISKGDGAHAFSSLCKGAESVIEERWKEESGFELKPKQSGRGAAVEMRKRSAAMASGRLCTDVPTQRISAHENLQARLVEVSRRAARYHDETGSLTDRAQTLMLWDAIQFLAPKTCGDDWSHCFFGDVPTAENAVGLQEAHLTLLQWEQEQVRTQRRAAFSNRVRSDVRYRFQLLRDPVVPVACVRDQNGDCQFAPETVLKLITSAWKELLTTHSWGGEAPNAQDFVDKYQHLVTRKVWVPPPLIGADLRKKALRKPNHIQGGLDGWTAKGVKLWPMVLWDAAADLFTLWETQGKQATLPACLLKQLISALPKADTGDVMDIRPIRVLSILWSIWGGVRSEQAKDWLDGVLPDCVRGGRKGGRCQDITWTLRALIERCLLEGTAMTGLVMDRVKCFDNMEWDVVEANAAMWGFPTPLSDTAQALVENSEVAFKHGGLVGEWFSPTKSYPQGDVWSVLKIVLLIATWALDQAEALPHAVIGVYLDDSNLAAISVEDIAVSLERSEQFDKLSGQKLHTGKSVAYSTSKVCEKELSKLSIRGTPLKTERSAVLLGGILSTQRKSCKARANGKILTVLSTIDRINRVPMTKDQCADAIAAKPLSKLEWDADFEVPTKRNINTCRAKVAKSLCRSNIASRASLFTLCYQGHRLDPWQRLHYFALVQSRDQVVAGRAADKENLAKIWDLRTSAVKSRMPGVGKRLLEAADFLGGEWTSPTCICLGDETLDLENPSGQAFRHDVREALRNATWANAPVRKDTAGVEGGIDFEATRAYAMKRKNKDPKHIGCVRLALAGGVWTQRRYHKANMVSTPTCVYCGMQTDEDQMHLYWECPKWERFRTDLFESFTMEQIAVQPPCFTMCGILPRDQALGEAVEASIARGIDNEPAPPPRLQTDDDCEVFVDINGISRILSATDGACRCQSSSLLRRAGWGGSFGAGHSQNFSFPLRGGRRKQSAQRAEVRAVTRLFAIAWRPTHVLCDNAYVIETLEKMSCGPLDLDKSEHADRWKRTQLAWRAKGEGAFFSWEKVKSHCKQKDVDAERISKTYLDYNSLADTLATQGADCHRVPTPLHIKHQERCDMAMAVQRMMAHIIDAKITAEKALPAELRPKHAEPSADEGTAAQVVPIDPAEYARLVQADPEKEMPGYPWHFAAQSDVRTHGAIYGEDPPQDWTSSAGQGIMVLGAWAMAAPQVVFQSIAMGHSC